MVARRQPSCVRHTLRRALRREPSVTARSDWARCPARRTATLDRTAGSSCRRWKDLSPVFRATHAPRVTCRTFLKPDLPACRSSEQDQHSKGRTMKNSRHVSRRGSLAAAPIAGLALLVAVASSAYAATAVGLGTADSFVVLAASGVTNTGTTTLRGDLGAANGLVTGDTDLVFTSGVNHYGDGQTLGAVADLETAYGAASQPVTETVSANLGGQELVPGVYFQASTMNLSGPALTLNAGGNADAVWIFRAGSDLIVGPGASVNLTNGAQACNVFWQVASSASLDDGADFIGTIMARAAITLNARATVEGRVLALGPDADITLVSNTITRPVCEAPPTPGGTTTPGGTQVAATPTGGVSTGDGSTSQGMTTGKYLLIGVLVVTAAGAMGAVAGLRRKQNT